MSLYLSELVAEVEKRLPPSETGPHRDVWVETQLGWLRPWSLCSYRGFYEQLAIVVSDDRRKPQYTIHDLHTEASEALNGKVFEGYKGGKYRMGAMTYVWVVLSRDRTSSLTLSAVRETDEGDIILETDTAPY